MRALLVLAAFTMSLLAGCGDADAQRAKLAGTWQRDVELADGKACAILVLEHKGQFTESLHVFGSNGYSQHVEYGGQWLTNGSSFTLRYLRENDRQYSGGKIRFLTLQLTSVSIDKFVGRDELRSRDVSFVRVRGPQCDPSPNHSIKPTPNGAAHIKR